MKTYLGRLSLLEKGLLAGLVLGLVGDKVLGLRDLVNLLGVEARKVDLVRGGDDVSRVDPSQRNTVDLEGAGDEKDTLVEGLDENDALAAEAAGEKNEDGSGLERLPGSPGTGGLADLRREKTEAKISTRSLPSFERDMPDPGAVRQLSVSSLHIQCQTRLLPATARPPRPSGTGSGIRPKNSYLLEHGLVVGPVPLFGPVGGRGNLARRLGELLDRGLRRHDALLAAFSVRS